MGYVAETEVGVSYINGQVAIPLQQAFEEIVHPRLLTPMQVDNSFSVGFSNGAAKKKRSKAMDVRFYWVQDQAKQGQFIIY